MMEKEFDKENSESEKEKTPEVNGAEETSKDTEGEKRKEIPSHDAWAAFIGTLDISKISAEEANAFVDKFEEWLELQRQIEEADKKIAAEKDDAEKSKLEEEKLGLEEKAKQLEEEKNNAAESAESKLNSPEENEEEVVLESKKGSEQSDDWSKTEAHWKKWCEEKGYVYEQNEEDKQKEGFAFRYYSSPEKQASGESEARVHYVNKNLAKVATSNGKPASFEFWRSFAKEAEKNNRIINFDKTKNTENQAKLYLACKILGVETSNVDESKLNFAKAFGELDDKDKELAQQVLGLDEEGNRIAPDANNKEKSEPTDVKDKEKDTRLIDGPIDYKDEKEYTLKDIYALELYVTSEEATDDSYSYANLVQAKKKVFDNDKNIKKEYMGVNENMKIVDPKKNNVYQTAKRRYELMQKAAGKNKEGFYNKVTLNQYVNTANRDIKKERESRVENTQVNSGSSR